MKKNKIIKGLLFSTVFAVLMNLSCLNVFAASFSVSASKSSVTPGGKFTVTISVGGAGQFNVSASNGSVSTNSVFADGSASVTVTAGQSGKTTVTVSAVDVTATDESPVTGSKSVSVSIKSSSNGGGSSSNGGSSNGGNSSGGSSETPKEDTRSKENNLSSLSISSGTLSPVFSADKTTYKVDLTSDIKKITINAKAKDSKASVSGTGEHELKVGENNFVITVKAENGSKKTYTISVYVTEKPSVFLKMGDQNLGVLNDYSKVDVPKGFEKTKITIDGNEISALKNDTLGLTVVYLQNETQETGFYIYENNKIVRKFETITVNGKLYILMDAPQDLKGLQGLKSGNIKIGEVEIPGWTFKDKDLKDYSVVYLMNELGEKSLYTYEATEQTLQKFKASESADNSVLTYIFTGTTVVFAAGTGVLAYLYFSFKKKSISAIKDYYDKKNQGE